MRDGSASPVGCRLTSVKARQPIVAAASVSSGVAERLPLFVVTMLAMRGIKCRPQTRRWSRMRFGQSGYVQCG